MEQPLIFSSLCKYTIFVSSCLILAEDKDKRYMRSDKIGNQLFLAQQK